MCVDALHRAESCGGHFRAESQTPDGEALRHDDEFSYVAAWQFTGTGEPPVLRKENLTYEFVEMKQRSYKSTDPQDLASAEHLREGRHPHLRSATVHVKPAHAAPLLGDTADTNKWPEIFKACEGVGGTEWYIVEYDGGSMDKVVRTMDVLKKWGKV